MSLKAFLRVGYNVLVEAYRGLGGGDLISAVDKANQSLGLTPRAEPVAAGGVPSPSDNDLALAELQRATAGLKRRK